jgi:hypothetical protein
MKMSKELFGELCDAIDSVMERYSLNVILQHRRDVKYVKNQFVSFCWSMFHAAKFDYKLFYDAGLNDNHIETALKRILSDFA